MTSDTCIAIDDYHTMHSTFRIHVLAAGGLKDPPVLLLHDLAQGEALIAAALPRSSRNLRQAAILRSADGTRL